MEYDVYEKSHDPGRKGHYPDRSGDRVLHGGGNEDAGGDKSSLLTWMRKDSVFSSTFKVHTLYVIGFFLEIRRIGVHQSVRFGGSAWHQN